MSKGTYRGVVKNSTIVLLGATAELVEGTEVLVMPLPKPGDEGALLAAIKAEPYVSQEDVDELLRVIEEGKLEWARSYVRAKEAELQAKETQGENQAP